MTSWLLLLFAACAEIGWVIGLKYTEGFTKPLPSVLTLASMAASMYLLALAARALPIGTAYAVWTGIGAVGAVLAGIILFGEQANPARLLCIALVIAGVVGLKLTTPN